MAKHGTTAPVIPGLDVAGDDTTRWFSPIGSVRVTETGAEVFVGGTLIGNFDHDDRAARNVLVVGLSLDPKMHLGHLATAFGIAVESLRLMRRQYESEGLAALIGRAPGGNRSKLTSSDRAELCKLLERGLSVREIEQRVGKRMHVSKSAIGRVRLEWEQQRRTETTALQVTQASDAQAVLPVEQAVVPSAPRASVTSTQQADVSTVAEATPRAHESETDTSAKQLVAPENTEETAMTSSPCRAPEEFEADDDDIDATTPRSGRSIQHVGAWMLLAMVMKLGLHGAAEEFRGERVKRDALRLALDAAVLALAIRERCIEGVRRLATACGTALLRVARVPSASWVRRVLGRFARDPVSAQLHLRMVGMYLREKQTESGDAPAVFYVDNHLRPYTGKHVVRRGWRMQDKRVVPGATDFYVHDEDGRPVMRVASPSNESLTAWLSPIARLLRMALGPEQKIMIAFDRGGSYPAQLAELRDEGFEFVTYERKPYPLLTTTAFEQNVTIDGESYGIWDGRKNLGKGRGRVRRLAMRTPDGRQVNVLAISEQEPAWLLGTMFGRWSQENGIKHIVERWGANQLDGRTTQQYAPDTIIPNPARRRLDRALRIAKAREGEARRELAQLNADDPKRAHWQREIEEATAQQHQIESQRPSTPKKAPLKDTELADRLVHHEFDYKLLIDTIRVACANAETDLAGELATHLRQPNEAKRTLLNVLNAPGRVRVGTRTIAVDLQPAGTASEIAAMNGLCATVNSWKLTLPGDAKRRALRFRCPR